MGYIRPSCSEDLGVSHLSFLLCFDTDVSLLFPPRSTRTAQSVGSASLHFHDETVWRVQVGGARGRGGGGRGLGKTSVDCSLSPNFLTTRFLSFPPQGAPAPFEVVWPNLGMTVAEKSSRNTVMWVDRGWGGLLIHRESHVG